MELSTAFVLEPPYQIARRHGVDPGLGSILLLDTQPERPTTNTVKDQMEAAPWCPLCLLADKDSGVRQTRRLPRTCVVFGLSEADGAAAILKAVAARPRPTPSDQVAWIQRRTRTATLGRTLSDLFTRPAIRRNEESLLPYAVREQLRQLGEWGASNWQRASTLVEVAADRSLLNRTMAAEDALSLELRRSIVELLGVSETVFRDRFGWEWVLECSLRRSGFFEQTTRQVRPLHVINRSAELTRNDWRGDGRGVVQGHRATA